MESTTTKGTKYVHRALYHSSELVSETQENDLIEVPDFQGVPTGKVSVEASVTKNLGNYESARISVGITLPCLPADSEVVATYSHVNELVQAMIEEQLSEVNNRGR